MARGHILFILSSLLVVPVRAQEPPDRDARLTSTAGTVSLKTTENLIHAVEVNVQVPLGPGDVIRTGVDGRAEVVMDADTVISLLPDSDFQVESLSPRDTRVALLRGAILAKVRTLKADEEFSVDLPTAVVGIRGTEFGIGLEFGQSHIGVFEEGIVTVTASKGGSSITLSPNQETLVYPTGLLRKPHPLAFFHASKAHMVVLRQRAAHWPSQWKPISSLERKNIRQQLFLIKPKPHAAPHASEPALRQNETPRRKRSGRRQK